MIPETNEITTPEKRELEALFSILNNYSHDEAMAYFRQLGAQNNGKKAGIVLHSAANHLQQLIQRVDMQTEDMGTVKLNLRLIQQMFMNGNFAQSLQGKMMGEAIKRTIDIIDNM